MNDRESIRLPNLPFIIHSCSFLISSLDSQTDVSILFGMANQVKQIFSIGDRQYELIEVDGPISRQNRLFPAQFDHEAGVLRISKTVPPEQLAWVVAVAVSDACFQLWKPLPVIWPAGWPLGQSPRWPVDRRVLPPRPPGTEGDRPHP
jgi:hypothetical protein